MSQAELNPEKLVPKPFLKPVLFSILTLVSGIIIGSAATLMTADLSPKKPVPLGPEYLSGRMIEHLVRELHLSPEQQQQLGPIVKKHMEEMEKIREIARPQIAEEIKQMNDEIMALLDEGQKQIWKDTIQRMQDNFPRSHQRRRPGYSPRDKSDPNSRPDESRPPRYFRDDRPLENRNRSEFMPPPGEERIPQNLP